MPRTVGFDIVPTARLAESSYAEVAVEQDQDNSGVSGISRGQNHLHVLPEDWRATARIVEALLDRVEAAAAGPQLLIVTSDADAAAAIALTLTSMARARNLRVAAATDVRRTSRVFKAAPPHIAVVPVRMAVSLMQASVLKLDALRSVMLAWLDARDAAVMEALEALMSETPKDAARVVLADSESAALEQLVERYARRALRAPVAASALAPVSITYVTTSEDTRLSTLRKLLDALDPEPGSAFILTTAPDSLERVQALLHGMGYEGDAGVRVGRDPATEAQVLVLFDMPATEEELRRLAPGEAPPQIIALITPRQLEALRQLAGGHVTPFVLPDAAQRARDREELMRDELRRALADGHYARELLALEPLLSEYDATEIAAAALRLLEAERAKGVVASTAQREATGASSGAMTRLYVNVGSMDNVRPADLVGAIVNEAGVARGDVGKVDVRDKHSTVEVGTHVANAVVAKITGISIRGRRVLARVDEREGRSDRPPRRDRNDRPNRGERPDRGDRRDGSERRERDGARPRSSERRRFPKPT